jgi:hypothetical protein
MKIEPTTYPGWNNYPVYRVKSYDDYVEICSWMNKNKVESFLLGTGSIGYIFQVRKNHEWFALRWLA